MGARGARHVLCTLRATYRLSGHGASLTSWAGFGVWFWLCPLGLGIAGWRHSLLITAVLITCVPVVGDIRLAPGSLAGCCFSLAGLLNPSPRINVQRLFSPSASPPTRQRSSHKCNVPWLVPPSLTLNISRLSHLCCHPFRGSLQITRALTTSSPTPPSATAPASPIRLPIIRVQSSPDALHPVTRISSPFPASTRLADGKVCNSFCPHRPSTARYSLTTAPRARDAGSSSFPLR